MTRMRGETRSRDVHATNAASAAITAPLAAGALGRAATLDIAHLSGCWPCSRGIALLRARHLLRFRPSQLPTRCRVRNCTHRAWHGLALLQGHAFLRPLAQRLRIVRAHAPRSRHTFSVFCLENNSRAPGRRPLYLHPVARDTAVTRSRFGGSLDPRSGKFSCTPFCYTSLGF